MISGATGHRANAQVCSDEANACNGISNYSEAVLFFVREHVCNMVRTVRTATFWSMFQRSHIGIFHRFAAGRQGAASPKSEVTSARIA